MTSRFERTSDQRREALRAALPATADLLKRRRAAEIAAADIDDYVALNWLEWNGGGLRLTTTGDNVCRQFAPRSVVEDPPVSPAP